MITGIIVAVVYFGSILVAEEERGWREFRQIWGWMKTLGRGVRAVGRTVATGKISLDPPRRAPAPELNEKWACKHPEDDLVEIRSDVMKKGELVATLCTKCDKQLGPEVWQAVLDRKFDEWTREHETLAEQEAERKRIGDELRAEQASLEAMATHELQYVLDDAQHTLQGLRWGVSGEQDKKRREISNNCQKWRKELERRGVKEVPSWHRRMQEKLLPKQSEPFDAASIYLQVAPNFNFAEEVLRPQIEAITKRTDAVVADAYENLITANIEMIAKTFCIPAVQIRDSPVERFSEIVRLHETGILTREAALAILEGDDGIRDAYETADVVAWGQATPVRTIAVSGEPYRETWGASDWQAANWRMVRPPRPTPEGSVEIEMKHPVHGHRYIRLHSDASYENWMSR